MKFFTGVLIAVLVSVTFFAITRTTAQEFVIESVTLSLAETGTGCVVNYQINSVHQRALLLNLEPPCNFATWTAEPLTNSSSPTEGNPVGNAGGIVAWRYENGVVVVPIIGDPIPQQWQSQQLYKLRSNQGLTCGASLQGILMRSQELRVSSIRKHIGIFCIELGVSAKDAWLLAKSFSSIK